MIEWYRFFTNVVLTSALFISSEVVAHESSDVTSLKEAVAELKAKIHYMEDRNKIHDLYMRYIRGFDRNDVGLMRSAFWSDAQINYGGRSNTLEDFVTKHLNRHTLELAMWGHLVTNETVDINGDTAHVETYVTALWMPKDHKSFAHQRPIVGGRYIDRLDRRDGEWRISVREFIPHFQLKADVDPNAWDSYARNAKSQCALGTWDRRDPSYVRPLKPRPNKDIGPTCAE